MEHLVQIVAQSFYIRNLVVLITRLKPSWWLLPGLMGPLSWSGSGSIFQKRAWIRLIKLIGLAAAQKEWERQRKLNADKPRGTAQHDTMSDEKGKTLENLPITPHLTIS